MSNAGSVVYDAQGGAGWSDETTLEVVCDFLREYVDVDLIARYLNARIEEEEGMSLAPDDCGWEEYSA